MNPLPRLSALPPLVPSMVAPSPAAQRLALPMAPSAVGIARRGSPPLAMLTTGDPVGPQVAAADSTVEVDDKVLRRRLQYKYHQRRHRAKQKEKTLALERDVQALTADVQVLQRQREELQRRVAARNGGGVDLRFGAGDEWFASRGTLCGAPARYVAEYLRQYQFGWSARREAEQQSFMRSIMNESTRGPDYIGVEFILKQWKLFGAIFASFRYESTTFEVKTAGELTVVFMDTALYLRPHREGLLALCPGVQNCEDVVQQIVGTLLSVPCRYQFVFDESGKCVYFGADMDFLSALQRAVGSLSRTAELFLDTRMSSSTGQIHCSPTDIQPQSPPPATAPASSDPRLQLDFLLS